MNNSFNIGWTNVKNDDINHVMDLILTGKSVIEAKPDNWLYEFIGSKNDKFHILDFGCGVGRNTFGMAMHSPDWKVIGYDNDAMLSRTKEYFNVHYKENFPNSLIFTSDWDYVKNHKFDVIIAILVLQHISEQHLNKYISDFKKITERLFVLGRRNNDDNNKNTWEILENNGLIPYKTLGNYSVEGDPEEHTTCFYRFD